MPQTGWTIAGPERLLEFVETVRPFLERDPIGNTVLLGGLGGAPAAVGGSEPHAEDCYGWWTDGTGALGAAFRRVGGRVGGSALTLSAQFAEAAAGSLARAWQESDRARPAGVFGKVATAERIAASWAASSGVSYRARPGHAMRLFSLAEPTPPDPAPRGSGRLATPDEAELASAWELAFLEDCGAPDRGGREKSVRARIAEGRQMMWEVDGEPVAQATHTPLAAGAVRIQGVYTPPENRRRGYAAGLTWALTRHALANGAEHVLLHTDVSNPTSNGVYQRLGFRPVHDVAEFELIG